MSKIRITPTRQNIRLPNFLIQNPNHSTPAPKDSVKKDLQSIFSNITTDNTENISNELSFSLNPFLLMVDKSSICGKEAFKKVNSFDAVQPASKLIGQEPEDASKLIG